MVTQTGTVLNITGGSGKAINPEEYVTRQMGKVKYDRDLRPCRRLPDEFLAPPSKSGFRGSDSPDPASESRRKRRWNYEEKDGYKDKRGPWVDSTYYSSAFGDEQSQPDQDADFVAHNSILRDLRGFRDLQIQIQVEDGATTGENQSCSHDPKPSIIPRMDFSSEDEDVFSPATRQVVDDMCEEEAKVAGRAAAVLATVSGLSTKGWLISAVQAVFVPCQEYGFTQSKADALAVSVVSRIAGEQAASEGKSVEEVESAQKLQAERASQLLKDLRLPERPMPTKKQRRQ